MNRLAYLIIISVFFSSFFASLIHRAFNLIPEMVSGIVLVVILGRIAVNRSLYLNRKYVLLAAIASAHMALSIVFNMVDPGTVISGLRPYLKWLPIFLLPAVYAFSDEELGKQFKLILALALMQCPIAIFQRFVQYRHVSTGDVVTGTLGDNASGVLSLLLLSVLAVVFTKYYREEITARRLAVLAIALFLPTAINETKVTLVLLPFVIVLPFLISARRRPLYQLIGIPTLGLMFTIGFVYIYDYVVTSWGQPGILEFFDKQAGIYLYSEVEIAGDRLLREDRLGSGLVLPDDPISRDEGGGRVDKILLPVEVLSGQSIKLWTGLGVGNVSTSVIGKFSGQYASKLGEISGETLLSYLIWEVGIGGVLLLVVFLWFIFYDSHALSRRSGDIVSLAKAWLTVTLMVSVTVAYMNLFFSNTLIYLFALYSGVLASRVQRLRFVADGGLSQGAAKNATRVGSPV